MLTRKIARDARTGRFIPISEARKRPATTLIERYIVPLLGVHRGKLHRVCPGASRCQFTHVSP